MTTMVQPSRTQSVTCQGCQVTTKLVIWPCGCEFHANRSHKKGCGFNTSSFSDQSCGQSGHPKTHHARA